MKNLKSTIEGTWVELKQVEITEEQKNLLKSNRDEDIEAKNELALNIKSLREVNASKKDSTKAQAIYESIKPELKDKDVYELISININDEKGILNCRINGEHKQIRF